MSIGTYDNPIQVSYRFAAATVSAAAVIGRFIGPAGRKGRVLDLSYIVTTGVTVAASVITVDTNAGLADPVTVSIPVSSANAGGSATRAAKLTQTDLPADTVIEVQSDGGSTAGAADINVTVGWF